MAVYEKNVSVGGGLTNTKALSVVVASSPLSIVMPSTLASGVKNVAYTQSFIATGGTTPYAWSLYRHTLPDGLMLNATGSSAGFHGPNGEVLVHAPQYANLGSLIDTLVLSEDSSGAFLDNSISGTLSWFKPTTSTRTYKSSFGPVSLNAAGKYLAPAATGHVVVGLPATGSASLSFVRGIVNDSAVDPSVAFTCTAANMVTMPANSTKTTLTINKSDSAISGACTLTYTTPTLIRNVSFQGMIMRPTTGTGKAVGFYLLPQKPGTSTSANLSGAIKLEQWPRRMMKRQPWEDERFFVRMPAAMSR